MQAARAGADCHDGSGYIYSFNGPQSLFVDTIRSLRVAGPRPSARPRLIGRATTSGSACSSGWSKHATPPPASTSGTAKAATRTTCPAAPPTRAIFNTNDGRYRCPSTSRATRRSARGPAAWPGRCSALPNSSSSSTTRRRRRRLERGGSRRRDRDRSCARPRGRRATFTSITRPHRRHPLLGHRRTRPGAAGRLSDRPADPFNDHEPVDSSAAGNRRQGLLRFGRLSERRGDDGARYVQAGLRCSTC